MSFDTAASNTRHDTSQDQRTASILPHESTRKRTRDDDDEPTDIDIDKRPFTIQPNASDPFARPQTFTPICLLRRAQLPLAFLDTSQSGGRLFAACVQILEACNDHGDGSSVLVVEDENEGRFYAIERTQRRQYALCRIGNWVKREELDKRSRTATQSILPAKRQALQTTDGRPWWMATAAVVPPKLSTALGAKGTTLSMRAEEAESIQDQSHTPALALDDANLKPASPEEALEELTKQYLDSLYISRTPIAYFVKGPLARARAALSQPEDLVGFLRGTILPSAVIEKKYRENIPEIVKELPLLETPEAKPKSKRKRKWKPKRDKYGFFNDEKDLVEQWWRKDETNYVAPSPGETLDATIRRRSQRLRNRETFLQVVLVLEVMTLEASASAKPAPTDVDTQNTLLKETMADKKSRKKKEIDIASILDNLLDRLDIQYQTEDISPAKDDTGNMSFSTGGVNDDLKSFASEVVIPFYGARIPHSAYSTSEKLGGPTAPTPAKRKSTSAPKKPGEPATRQAPEKKPRRPLERVSTDTLNHVVKRAPTLHRSATDSEALAPLIKREKSNTPSLESIPWTKNGRHQPNQARPKKRVSILDQMSRREIDLSAMSQKNEAKLKKTADLNEKLRKTADINETKRESISMVKKPNRERALEDYAKEVDERFAKAISKGSSRSTAQQRRGGEKVSVVATPKHIKATPAPKRSPNYAPDFSRRSGGISIVPSSSARLMAQPGDIPGSTFAVPQTGHRARRINVEETPSRGFAKFIPTTLSREPGTLIESPTAKRSAPILQTPAKSLRMPLLDETPAKKILSTPTNRFKGGQLSTKKDAIAMELQRQEPTATPRQEPDKGNIYDALGWNDDYDIPLT